MPKHLMALDALLAQIETDPIAGAKAAQKRNLGVREGAYESSVSAGALYRALKDNAPLRTAFYALPFWEGGYKKNHENLNTHCHQFVYDAREGSEGKRAEDHAGATQSYLDDPQKSLDDILNALKEAGFDGLRKASPAQMARNKAQAAASQDDQMVEDHNANRAERSKSASSVAPKTAPAPTITMSRVFEHLLITMDPSELARFLDDQSEVGDRFKIVVERDENSAAGLLIWRAIEIKHLDVAAA